MAGNLDYDYLLGIAALDSGQPDKASLALERVLAVTPDYVGAGSILARAYFALAIMNGRKPSSRRAGSRILPCRQDRDRAIPDGHRQETQPRHHVPLS